MNLSIVIPSFNESESINELHQWIIRVLKRMDIVYEIIIIDDGSNDNSWLEIKRIAKKTIKLVQLGFLETLENLKHYTLVLIYQKEK